MQYEKPRVERQRVVGEMGSNPSWCREGYICTPKLS